MQQTLGDLEVGRRHIEKPLEGRNEAKLTEPSKNRKPKSTD
jgi:hypothetical protein